jgi:hypothetical protein
VLGQDYVSPIERIHGTVSYCTITFPVIFG